MTPHDHESRWEYLYAAHARESRRRTLAPLLSFAGWLALALACVLGFTLLSDCGDVQADPEPEPVPAAESHPAESQRIPVDPEAFALAARFMVWQPLWRPRRAGELEVVAAAVMRACHAAPWPTPERCPDLLLALAFKESSLRSDAVGRRGEIGLVQLMPGAALAGETRADAADPERNLSLGLSWLRRAALLCRMAGHGGDEAALSVYAGLRCGPSRGAKLVLRWESELRGGGGGA